MAGKTKIAKKVASVTQAKKRETKSVQISLRVKPNVHAFIAAAARKQGVSINAFIDHAVDYYTSHCLEHRP